MPYPSHDTSIYSVDIDPSRANDAHAFMLELTGYNKRVLELGCTAGHMTRALVKQGCTVVGVELDPEAADHAREVAEEVIVGDLDQPEILATLTPGQFDVILAGDVLEHLRDPMTPLRASRPLLKPGGELVVSIPNVAHADLRLRLLDGDFPYQPYGLLDTTHLRFFTWQTLKDLLYAAGYVPIEAKRVIVPMFGSELAVDRSRVDPQVVDMILRDPECETYQFVVRCVVDDGNAAVTEIAGRLERLESELRDQTIERALLAQQLTATEEKLRLADARAVQAEGKATAAEQSVSALEQTSLFRHTYRARQVYARFRGFSSGAGAGGPGANGKRP
jgi:SAM-dependent methyltransferase